MARWKPVLPGEQPLEGRKAATVPGYFLAGVS